MDIGQKELPAGWKWVKLGDVCEEQRRTIRPDEPAAKTLPYLSLEHIQSQTGLILTSPEDISEDTGKSNTFCFDDSHILYGKLRPYLNKVALPNFPGRCTTELIPLKPTVANRDYLWWLLKRPATVSYAMMGKTGSRMPRTNMKEFMGMPIPLPPLEEQKHIAGILNEQMAAVEEAKKAAQERLEAAKALPAAYLREVFEGTTPVSVEKNVPTSPHGWQWRLLSDLAQLESGHTPSRRHPEYWAEGDIPWLALPDIRAIDGDYCNTTSEFTNHLGIQNSSARVLPKGTVALSRTASVGFVTIFGRPMATSQDFVNWVCGDHLVPEFLLTAFLASRNYIRGLSSGATHKTVYVPTVKTFKVCLPNYSEQERIVGEYNDKLAGVKLAEASIQQELDTIEAMPAALLRKAFAGGL